MLQIPSPNPTEQMYLALETRRRERAWQNDLVAQLLDASKTCNECAKLITCYKHGDIATKTLQSIRNMPHDAQYNLGRTMEQTYGTKKISR